MFVAQSAPTVSLVMALGLLVALAIGAVVLLAGIEYVFLDSHKIRRNIFGGVGAVVVVIVAGAVIFGFRSVPEPSGADDSFGASLQQLAGEAAWIDGVPLSWMVIVTAVISLIVAQFVLRKAEAWAFWRTSWSPAGAIASAAVMATAGSVFVTQFRPASDQAEALTLPTFGQFVEDQFGQVSGNSGYGDLLAMAGDPELSEDEARSLDLESVGTTEENGFFTAGHAASPTLHGIWDPLLVFDEGQGAHLLPDGNDLGKGEFIPVSIGNLDEAIPDDAVLSPASDPNVRLFAVASGRFTTVSEAWDDLSVKLGRRVPVANPDGKPDDQQRLAIRGLTEATRRLAVVREPLILEDEVDGDLVQPMYRVHVGLDQAVWDDVAKPRFERSEPVRQRALILLGSLAGLTLVFGGVAGRFASTADPSTVA